MPNLKIYLGQYKDTKIGSLIYYEIMIQLFLVSVSQNAPIFLDHRISYAFYGMGW